MEETCDSIGVGFVMGLLFCFPSIGWRRSRVDLLLEMDGAEVMSGSEMVALMRFVEVGCLGAVGRLRPLIGLETVEQLVGVGDEGGCADVAVVMGDLIGDGGTGVGTLVGTLVGNGAKLLSKVTHPQRGHVS